MSTNKRVFAVAVLCLSLPVLAGAGFNLILEQAVMDRVEATYGSDARERVSKWAALVAEDKVLDISRNEVKLTRANDYFNQVRWLSDLEHWGEEDYWATPVETLATNGGDCEDYSIGKYFSLLATAVDNDKLRITYVKSLTYNQAHMVLAYYPEPDAEPLILDNINKTILPASKRKDLIPVYSFSGDSIWLAKARGKKLNTSSQSGLPRWKQVNERFKLQLSEAKDD